MREGIVQSINGPVVKGYDMLGFTVREMVLVGEQKLIGEVISLENDTATIQVYEETEGLSVGEKIISTGAPLSVRLGPGLIGNMFDGIQRPLIRIKEQYGGFIPQGVGLMNLDMEKKWDVTLTIKKGDKVHEGEIFGEIPETSLITNRLMVPIGVSGTVVDVVSNGKYSMDQVLGVVEDADGNRHELKMYQDWPVRVPRPVQEELPVDKLLMTGQRVLDIFFPVAKGGTVAIPGGFGTGKTMLQHQLAGYCDADIIVYIGCGERGNEMTQVLEDFPKLIDPNSGKPLMDRTILIANTSNMPVAAREASIYTGITMAEYFRDMGYSVALMADSTSRWAEALREISGRLEEIPAEEGYPAYLGSRLSQFYERSGDVRALSGKEGSVTLIGAVSPAGGDFSEPVTENTKRCVNVFLGLDKELAYSRHYPAINWLQSYSKYLDQLGTYYEEILGEDVLSLRNEMMNLLNEEARLKDIVMLVGEDALPDAQRLLLKVAEVIRVGFLQQNAFNKLDSYVPLEKQVEMLKTIRLLYRESKKAIEVGADISEAYEPNLFKEVTMAKYHVENDNLEELTHINNEIEAYYEPLIARFKERSEE